MNTQKLKPFNLERALAGDPVVTREGKKLLEFHHFSTINGRCIYGKVEVFEGSYAPWRWHINGKYYNHSDDRSDLLMAPIERCGFIKIFPVNIGTIKANTSCVFDSEAEAAAQIFLPGHENGIVIPISWSE